MEVKVGVKVEVKVGVKVGVKVEVKVGVKVEVKVGVKVEVKVEVKVGTKRKLWELIIGLLFAAPCDGACGEDEDPCNRCCEAVDDEEIMETQPADQPS